MKELLLFLFIEEETEAERDEVICSGSHSLVTDSKFKILKISTLQQHSGTWNQSYIENQLESENWKKQF